MPALNAIGRFNKSQFYSSPRRTVTTFDNNHQRFTGICAQKFKISLLSDQQVCYDDPPMSIAKKPAFSRRLPDLVTEELASALSRRSGYEFKDLFDVVHENLKARNAASGGEEMLRLRAYEKLQNLVSRGMVKITVGKDGKKSYKGLPKQLATLQTNVTPAI